ncbi:AAA family ATPase [Plantactinospora alkalitolerans]|uniref:AAA family ATPase n=1 Tax=Plantactinospora alkalitolerans TaxID=2789879 RepID=UPI001E60E616|nr:AAA family ATPase [Plantactinospora alkalitolerans]
MADLHSGEHRGVVVDSPPGAGKSTLVVRAAGELAEAGEPLIVIAQTNEQVDDLVGRLAQAQPELPIGRLSANEYTATERIKNYSTVRVAAKVADLGGSSVIIGTAAKWALVPEGRWPWAIVDEAYQMRSDALLRVAGRFDRALFVGDPGQLDPFSTVETGRWTGLTWDPMQSAVAALLRHNPELPVHRLPVSWRLPASAAPVVAEAFYPFTGFSAGTTASQRSLSFTAAGFGGGAVDEALELAAATGWALYELPARHTLRTDGEAAAACARLALRLLERGAVAVSERAPGGVAVTADRIAIGAAHRDQVAAIRPEPRADGAGITVDTANRLQGREYDVTIVLHPLSGRRDATAFHLEAGRLCVLTSRHRHACVVVARAGIAELLDAHPSTEPVHLNVPVRFPDGWEANQAIAAHLEKTKRLV